MSKAFTREADDDDAPRRSRARQASGLPPGAVNYLTEEGARRFRSELDELLRTERPRLSAEAAAGDATAAVRLGEVEGRIQTLQAILRGASIVPAATEAMEAVRLGATVTLRQVASGREMRYRVVGVEEAGLEPGWVSWRSEIGAALLHAGIGEKVALPGAAGEEIAEILSIEN
jgi:transcription elongation GreA/GreB family factor